MEQLRDTIVTGQMLYGFYEAPPLDVVINWSVTHSANVQASTNKVIYSINCLNYFMFYFSPAPIVFYLMVAELIIVSYASGLDIFIECKEILHTV